MYTKGFVLRAHLGVHYEVVSVRRLGRVLNALLRCTRVTLCDIFANRSLKQDGLLTHITNLKNKTRIFTAGGRTDEICGSTPSNKPD